MTTTSNLHFVTLFVSLAVLAVMIAIPQSATAMNKAELVESIASKSGLSKADSKKALDGFTDAPMQILEKGDRISLVGFGSFSISKRSARTGRNPQIGHGGGPDSGENVAPAQGYNASRSNKPTSVHDDGSSDSGENIASAQGFNASRSNKPTSVHDDGSSNSGENVAPTQDYNSTRSNKPGSVHDEDSDGDGDGHADPLFREDESSPEHEFTNPVGIDIQAGGDGVFIRVEPPETDPITVLHKKKSFTTVEPPNTDPITVLHKKK